MGPAGVCSTPEPHPRVSTRMETAGEEEFVMCGSIIGFRVDLGGFLYPDRPPVNSLGAI